MYTPQHQAKTWLAQQGIRNPRLTSLTGYTNDVFLVESEYSPKRSVIRLANHKLAAGFCPLAEHPKQVIHLHQQAVNLGLAPELLGFDEQLGIMWLVYAGEQRTLTPTDFATVQTLLKHLHNSDLVWYSPAQTTWDTASLQLLQGLQTSSNPVIHQTATQLLQLAAQRDYAQCPLRPVHSDLNPGNWLHDGARWWLIDWDYARLMVAEWDYASLIVEHAWDSTQALLLAPQIHPKDLAWFCASFALLSWNWHQQRGTDQATKKQSTTHYWLALC